MLSKYFIMKKRAQFRFYEELNDFLPPAKRKKEFIYQFMTKMEIWKVLTLHRGNTCSELRGREKMYSAKPSIHPEPRSSLELQLQ